MGRQGNTVMRRQERHDDGDTRVDIVMGRQERHSDGETGETQ